MIPESSGATPFGIFLLADEYLAASRASFENKAGFDIWADAVDGISFVRTLPENLHALAWNADRRFARLPA